MTAPLHDRLRPLVISAPFGNYVQPTGCTATLGTFTAMRRPGRLWRILLTVRYDPFVRAWVNKIGLRNPGVQWLALQARSGRIDVRDKIVSVHGFEPDEWHALLDAVAPLQPLAVELNLSCPNIGHISCPDDLFDRATATGVPVIAKLPPVLYDRLADRALAAGVRAFHCCNTLPVPTGGLSGPPLTRLALQCVEHVRKLAGDAVIIGGGGIQKPGDLAQFFNAGATHAAIGTKLMNPLYMLTHAPLRGLIDRAAQLAPRRPIPAH